MLTLSNPSALLGTKGRDFYSILDLKRSASPADIADAYRREAGRWHPANATGENAAVHHFRLVAEAYSVLSDPLLRELYDERGIKGLKEGVQGLIAPWVFAKDPLEVYESFYGSQSPFAAVIALESTLKKRPLSETKDKSIELPLWLSLEDLYHRRRQRVVFNRNVLSAVDNRSLVEEEGVVFVTPGDGWVEGGHLKFPGQGHHTHPLKQKGDLVLEIRLKKHKEFFLIKNNDLGMRKNVSLSDALTGFNLSFFSLSGIQQVIPVFGGITEGMELRLKGRGMKSEGDLVVTFSVEFPVLSESKKSALKQILA